MADNFFPTLFELRRELEFVLQFASRSSSRSRAGAGFRRIKRRERRRTPPSLIIVADQDRSRDFYSNVLGGKVIRQRNPAVVRLGNSWIVINSGGGPTDDKPDVIVAPPQSAHVLTSGLNIRVADVWTMYKEWKERGADFMTEPKDGQEIRCYIRDPDGHLIEVGQSTGILDNGGHKVPRH